MKAEFNPDGSIKLPQRFLEKKKNDEKVFETGRAIKIIRKQTSTTTPLTCKLSIQLSEYIREAFLVEKIFRKATGKFRHLAELYFKKLNNHKFLIEIISGQYRCSWCENFRRYLGEELSAKVINQGSCMEYTKSKRR